jgi:hypothetical protein
MPQIAGTTDTLDLVGTAEDIEDVINDISPTETPLYSMASKKTATATLHQWQTDALAAAGANRQIEGDDASFTTASPTVMLANNTQISRKTLIVSRTADRVRKYGRARELARLTTKYGKELKRDIEFALVTNQASSAGGNTTARSSAGLESMIAGNRITPASTSTHTTPGFAAGAWSAPTDGTAVTVLTADLKALLDNGIEAAWLDGGDPSVIMTNSTQKKRISGIPGATTFAGTYNIQQGKSQGMIVGGADVYVSDWGDHKVVLNRYMRSSIIFGVDPGYVSVAMLDGIKMEDLAKTGDAEKKMLICEYTLVGDQPDAHFKVAALA